MPIVMSGESFLYTRADYETAAEIVRVQVDVAPRIGLILGSGLGPLADRVEDATIIQVHDIPKWPQPTVEGHVGRLVIGHLEKSPCWSCRDGFIFMRATLSRRLPSPSGSCKCSESIH